MFSDIDSRHMRTALTLAARGLGRVAPNPAVGCVIIGPGGEVAGRGWTQPGGRPHAETEAIRRAGDKCRGAAAYVTLEPCDHRGRTGPCTQALIGAGVERVVIACRDPDRRVAGRGVKRLKAAGLEVVEGVLEGAARELNAGFFMRLAEGRPLFTLKAASSLDGRTATRTGDSKWITGQAARAAGHMLRARHDAIMIGIGTALADNPALTCRLPGMEQYSPARIIADGDLALPLSSPLVETAGRLPTIVIAATADKARARALKKAGVRVIAVGGGGRPDPEAMAAALGDMGLNSVLIEGGGKLAGAFMASGLVDRLAWFHGGRIIGGDGIPSLAAFGVESLSDAPSYSRSGLRTCGRDLFETYRRDNGA